MMVSCFVIALYDLCAPQLNGKNKVHGHDIIFARIAAFYTIAIVCHGKKIEINKSNWMEQIFALNFIYS